MKGVQRIHLSAEATKEAFEEYLNKRCTEFVKVAKAESESNARNWNGAGLEVIVTFESGNVTGPTIMPGLGESSPACVHPISSGAGRPPNLVFDGEHYYQRLADGSVAKVPFEDVGPI